MTNEEAIMRLEALRELSSEHSLKTIGKAIDMAIDALSVKPIGETLTIHIDPEAWTAEWENHYRSGVHAGTGAVCSSCDVWNGRKAHFCPFCGKAMTPEALAMLEKRLRG